MTRTYPKELRSNSYIIKGEGYIYDCRAEKGETQEKDEEES